MKPRRVVVDWEHLPIGNTLLNFEGLIAGTSGEQNNYFDPKLLKHNLLVNSRILTFDFSIVKNRENMTVLRNMR